jgi:aspartate 1-decarboxylase
MRWVLRSKIHKAIVTESEPDYVGSISIDEELLERTGLWAGERVLVASNTSGARLETYILVAEHGSGTIGMRGPAALQIKIGEEVIIMGFELTQEPVIPRVILVNKQNKFLEYL